MIERYWDEMFGEFKKPSGAFEIPGFPEPLMSAHFNVVNVFGDDSRDKHFSAFLCSFLPMGEISKEEVKSEDLARAIGGQEYWSFHEANYPQGVAFLRRLLPFLCGLSKPHLHFELRDEKGVAASLVAGIAESSAFLFAMTVRQDLRGQGVAARMTDAVRGFLGHRPCFYWTTHQWFILNAEAVVPYHVLKINQGADL